jgi:hypothetical protein
VALIQPADENQVGDKHVESLWLPRLDAGSTPASSTMKFINHLKTNTLMVFFFVFGQHLVNLFKITCFLL